MEQSSAELGHGHEQAVGQQEIPQQRIWKRRAPRSGNQRWAVPGAAPIPGVPGISLGGWGLPSDATMVPPRHPSPAPASPTKPSSPLHFL